MINILLTNIELCLVICIPILALLVIGVILLLFFKLRKRNKEIKVSENVTIIDETIYFAFGGKDNIKNVELKGSRLVIELIDQTKFEKVAIKDYGIDRVLVMSNKITLVGTKVNEIYSLLTK